ncbi:oxidoreductase [Dyella sp.]|jgi:predicted dehydrogenase|uniref:oxidoreductase n=1 Tax=Dyella sp. TaxID=1869338 RepID=UPI002D783B21|nr:oxidoreductase [Dyella sp.]HET6433346.1 oxidoreductase [Dyella sp.]
MPHPIRLGLIGYGYAGKTFHAPLIRATPGLELAAVASRDAAKVHADLPHIRVHETPAALIADDSLDVVVIATPNDTHAPLAADALRAGRHVVIDKPMALDRAEARALVALADRSTGQLSVFHNRRWDSDYLAVKQAIDNGLVGEVTHFESHIDRYRPAVRDRWRESAGPGAGIWYDLGPHLVDQVLQLFGLPERVHGALAIQRAGGLSDDWAHVRLDYGARQVILHASMLVAGGARRFVVHGTRGSLIKAGADRQEAQILAGMIPGAIGWGEDADPLIAIDAHGEARALPVAAGDQRRYYAALRDAIAGHAPWPVRPIEALATMAVIEAGFASGREGRAVALQLTDAERLASAAARA